MSRHVVCHDYRGIPTFHSTVYGTNHPQLEWSMCVTRILHACDMHGVNHTCVDFLDSTSMYMHAHVVFTHTHVFTHVLGCMANVAS